MSSRGRGRRPGGVDTRATIVEAARSEFAAKGYDATSLRGIARIAGVDPALVHHYFEGGKASLFTATMDLPLDPATIVGSVFDGHLDRLGWRVVQTFLRVWDAPERRDTLAALLRSSVSSDAGGRTLREFLGREVFGRIAASTGAPDAQLRGSLAASQMLGLAVLRYVLKAPSIVTASPEDLVERLGPVMQLHLVDSDAAQAYISSHDE